MASPKVVKRSGRRHYYVHFEGKYVSTGETDQYLAVQAARHIQAVGVKAYRQGKRTLGDSLPELIESHLEYLRDVDERGAEHIRHKRHQLFSPVEAGIFKKLKDVKKKPFEHWLYSLDCKPKTQKEYLTAWNVFLDWLVYEDMLTENPIKGKVRQPKVKTDDKDKRRDLTPEEVSRLVAVGGKHALLYQLAYATGARWEEIKSLRWEYVHEGAADPFLTLRFGTTKNGSQRKQYLSAELASALAQARTVAKTDRVFPTMPSHHTFNKHLKLAGIPKVTEDGKAVFHSLRHSYTTTVARISKDPRIAQRAAGHADITTTQQYMHTHDEELVGVMRDFPQVSSVERATRRATPVVQDCPSKGDEAQGSPETKAVSASGIEEVRPIVSNDDDHWPVVEPGGIEPTEKPAGESVSVDSSTGRASGRATCANISCRRLDAVIESWSTLPEHIREQVYFICKDNAAIEQMRLRTLTLPYPNHKHARRSPISV